MASIVSLLASLPESVARDLSDELQGAMRQSHIDNPFEYLRKLIEQYKAGTLVLQYAPRIRADRERANEAAFQRKMPRLPPNQDSQSSRNSMPKNWRASLNLP